MKKKEEFNTQGNTEILERIEKIESKVEDLKGCITNLSKFIDEDRVIVAHSFDHSDIYIPTHGYSITYISNRCVRQILVGNMYCPTVTRFNSDIDYSILKNTSDTLFIKIESKYYLINKRDNSYIEITNISDLIKE